jgi:hypothetical protein
MSPMFMVALWMLALMVARWRYGLVQVPSLPRSRTPATQALPPVRPGVSITTYNQTGGQNTLLVNGQRVRSGETVVLANNLCHELRTLGLSK